MRFDTFNPVFTIADTRRVYEDGVPYSCKYRLELNFPLNLVNVVNAETLNVMCQSIEIPRETIKPIKVWFRGRPLNLKGQLSYEDTFKVTVQDTGHFSARKEFEQWIALSDNLDNESSNDYKVDEVYVFHLDGKGKPTLKTTFYGVFLTELGGINLSDSSVEAITYDCTFAYSTFTTEVL